MREEGRGVSSERWKEKCYGKRYPGSPGSHLALASHLSEACNCSSAPVPKGMTFAVAAALASARLGVSLAPVGFGVNL